MNFSLIKILVCRRQPIEEQTFVGTGCKILNTFLKGGIPCNSITEFYGAPGSRKIQLALQLSLYAQKPKMAGGKFNGKNSVTRI